MKPNKDFSLITLQALAALAKIGQILGRYGRSDILSEVTECKELILDGKYKEFLERVNSPKWWGEGSISDLALFSSYQAGSEYEDARSFEVSLLYTANVLKENGIENPDAEEWVFRAGSWPHKK